MALTEMKSISIDRLESANVRPITSHWMNEIIPAIGNKEKEKELKKSHSGEKGWKDYFQELKSLYENMKLLGKNTNPITIVPLTIGEKGTGEADYGIISGHTRFSIARALGWEKIDAVVANEESRDKIRILALQSNVSGTSMTTDEKLVIIEKMLNEPQLDKNGNPRVYKVDTKSHKKGEVKTKTNEQVGAELGISEGYVRKLLKKSESIIQDKIEFPTVEYYNLENGSLEKSKDVDTLLTNFKKLNTTFNPADKKSSLKLFDEAGEIMEMAKQLRKQLQSIESVKGYIKERRSGIVSEARSKKD